MTLSVCVCVGWKGVEGRGCMKTVCFMCFRVVYCTYVHTSVCADVSHACHVYTSVSLSVCVRRVCVCLHVFVCM